MATSNPRNAENLEESVKKLQQLFRDLSTAEDGYQLKVTSRNGSSPLLIPAALSECRNLLKALDLQESTFNNNKKAKNIAELFRWASDLAIELNATTITDFISCVEIMSHRLQKWNRIFFNEESFKSYCKEIKHLINEYHRMYDISKPQFSNPLTAISLYIRQGSRLGCINLGEFIKIAQEGYGSGLKKEIKEMPDGSIRSVYLTWTTEGIYRTKNNHVSIETFHEKENIILMLDYKKKEILMYIFSILFMVAGFPLVLVLIGHLCSSAASAMWSLFGTIIKVVMVSLGELVVLAISLAWTYSWPFIEAIFSIS